MEAESQCAELDMTGQSDGTVTDDSDIWLFGGKRVYKNLFNQDRTVEFFTDTTIKEQLGSILTMSKLQYSGMGFVRCRGLFSMISSI